jgi:hypothetical protein
MQLLEGTHEKQLRRGTEELVNGTVQNDKIGKEYFNEVHTLSNCVLC